MHDAFCSSAPHISIYWLLSLRVLYSSYRSTLVTLGSSAGTETTEGKISVSEVEEG
jgi:hypothetical protein